MTERMIPSTIAIAAYFFNTGREVIKGMADIEGDREEGITTVSTLLGARGAAIVGAILCYIGAIPVVLVVIDPPSGFGTIGQLGLGVAVSFGLIVISYNIYNPSPTTSRRTKKTILWVFLLVMMSTLVDAIAQL